jgi:CheY-like chemotaxis protein
MNSPGFKTKKALDILHVDDELGFPKLIKSLVKCCNLRPSFHHVGSVADAIHYLEQTSTNAPDLILSDFEMPGANGLELLVWIRHSQFSEVPVVFVSGSDDAERITATLQAGADGWIQKSPDRTLEQCASQITHYCGGRCGKECKLAALFSPTST